MTTQIPPTDDATQPSPRYVEQGDPRYDVSDAAALVGVSTKTLYRAIDNGDLRAGRRGGRPRARLIIVHSQLMAWNEGTIDTTIGDHPAPRREREQSRRRAVYGRVAASSPGPIGERFDADAIRAYGQRAAGTVA